MATSKTIGLRLKLGQLAAVEAAAAAENETVIQWIRGAILDRLNDRAEADRFGALAARIDAAEANILATLNKFEAA